MLLYVKHWSNIDHLVSNFQEVFRWFVLKRINLVLFWRKSCSDYCCYSYRAPYGSSICCYYSTSASVWWVFIPILFTLCCLCVCILSCVRICCCKKRYQSRNPFSKSTSVNYLEVAYLKVLRVKRKSEIFFKTSEEHHQMQFTTTVGNIQHTTCLHHLDACSRYNRSFRPSAPLRMTIYQNTTTS